MKVKMKVKSLSRVRLPVTPWTAAYQAPLSMGFSRQEYWSGVPLPSLALLLLIFKICVFCPWDLRFCWATVSVLREMTLPVGNKISVLLKLKLPGGASGKEFACQCRRHKRCWFDPWRRAQQPTLVFLPGESHGRGVWWAIVCRVAKSWTWLKQLSMCAKLKHVARTQRIHKGVFCFFCTSGSGEWTVAASQAW